MVNEEWTFQPNVTIYSTSDYFLKNNKDIYASECESFKSSPHNRLYEDANSKRQNKDYYEQMKLK